MEHYSLDYYTECVLEIIKKYFRTGKIFTNIEPIISDELIGKCITRIVKADEKYEKGKSKLSLERFRRMHVIYAIRSYIQSKNKRKSKYININISHYSSLVDKKEQPFVSLEKNENDNVMIGKIEKANLDRKTKKYMMELINGKALIDIAHENRTTRPVVQRIIKQGVLKLQGE